MSIVALIRVVYLAYTAYICLLVNSTTLMTSDMLPGMVMMWVVYGFFYLGYSGVNTQRRRYMHHLFAESWLAKAKPIVLLWVFVSVGVSSVLAAYFYTGQTPATVIVRWLAGESTYTYFQQHFRAQQVYRMSLSKLPFFIMMAYVKLVFIGSWLALARTKKDAPVCLYLFGTSLAYLYFGAARGTSFEFFLFAMTIAFVNLHVPLRRFTPNKIGFLKYMAIFLVLLMAIAVFYVGVTIRGVNFFSALSREGVYFERGALLPQGLTYPFVAMYGYFGFGFYYFSTFFWELWSLNPLNAIAGFVPHGYQLFFNAPIHDFMLDLLYMGAKWQADLMLMINQMGLIGMLLCIAALGNIAKMIELKHMVVWRHAVLWAIFVQMASLPVGNFLHVSTPIVLAIAVLTLRWLADIIRA